MAKESSNHENYCIFTIVDGRVLFSETAVIEEKFIEFDSEKTLMIRFKPAEEEGQFLIEHIRLSSYLTKSSKMRFPMTSIIAMQDLTEFAVLEVMRNSIAKTDFPTISLSRPDILN